VQRRGRSALLYQWDDETRTNFVMSYIPHRYVDLEMYFADQQILAESFVDENNIINNNILNGMRMSTPTQEQLNTVAINT